MIYIVYHDGHSVIGAWNSFSAAREHADRYGLGTRIERFYGSQLLGVAERDPKTREWHIRWE